MITLIIHSYHLSLYIVSSGGLLGLCMGFRWCRQSENVSQRKLNHQQNIFSFVSLAEILYHCFICVSLFFKKSSKSTLVMKDLYTTTNGGETENLSGNCWGLRVIHRSDNTVKSNMSGDRHNFKTLVSYWYKGYVFGFECKSRSYAKHNFALALLLIEIL